jgi:5-methylcytosine-specific restriction endonuclease McrA
VEQDVKCLENLLHRLEGGRRFGGYKTYQEYLNSPHWEKTRQEALDRASGRCMLCNMNEEVLHVHHRTYERLGNEEPEDVIVLCATHHAQFHGKDGE